jgi:phosphinothricin acetyltransferase
VYEKHGCLDGTWIDVVIVERLIAENLGSPGGGAATSIHIASEE